MPSQESSAGKLEREPGVAGSASGGKFDAFLVLHWRIHAMSADVVGPIVSAKSSLKRCLLPLTGVIG